jgi:hypothetical protein
MTAVRRSAAARIGVVAVSDRPRAVLRDVVSRRSKADILLLRQLARGSLLTEQRDAADHRHLPGWPIRFGRTAGVFWLFDQVEFLLPARTNSEHWPFSGGGSTDDRSATWPIPQPQRSRN